MMSYYLAIDMGASSGRHILGSIEDGKIKLEEIYRFENGISKIGDEYCWDIQGLFNEIKKGIKKCKEIGKVPKTIGIDTWAVDFVLLDENDEMLGNAVAYRDDRTEGYMEKAFQVIPQDMLYLYTGIQFQRFNTLYQLLAIKDKNPEYLKKAKTFLMIPDYLNFLLTGKKANEYTNATSTQLVNSFDRTWDKNILKEYGINEEMFQEIKMPKTSLGKLRKELVDEFGFDMEVILPATHDTGSAFISSVCNDSDSIYVSSGTWSLIGVENRFPICVIQEVRRNLNNEFSFADLVVLAEEHNYFKSIVNVDDDRFLKPDNMIEEIQNYCKETNQDIPTKVGEIAVCVFNSLGHSYKSAVANLEDIFEKEFKRINIFGGGCQNNLLNQVVADVTGKEVLAGPVEATAIGNLVAQLISVGELKDLGQARQVIKESFDINIFKPNKGEV